MEKPSEGWKERSIITHIGLEIEKQQTQTNNNYLSFDEFKKQQLITFEQYAKARHEYFDCEMIDKGYELYCQEKYQKYLLEKGQVIPALFSNAQSL